MFLHNVSKSSGLNKKSKRLGRGNSQGRGNYSTKGLKGQKARSGHSLLPGFEGGQTRLVQRLPKLKGFKRFYKLVKNYDVINLGTIEADPRIESGMKVDKELLINFNYLRSNASLVKILADGEFTKKVDFVGFDAYSKAAKEAIEKSGSKIA